MLDLKTGRFVINEEKGWEFHPFMSREEFMKSDFFKTKYLAKNEDIKKKNSFTFGLVNIDGYEMYLHVIMGGLHDCVQMIRLTSVKMSAIPDINCMPDNWKEIAYDAKRIHDEFLQKETSLPNLENDKDNSFSISWGSFRSDFSLAYDIPSAEIVISYDNITDEDREQLKNIPLW